jgi:hypothetical protein
MRVAFQHSGFRCSSSTQSGRADGRRQRNSANRRRICWAVDVDACLTFLCGSDGEEMPLAGHALELLSAAILELES